MTKLGYIVGRSIVNHRMLALYTSSATILGLEIRRYRIISRKIVIVNYMYKKKILKLLGEFEYLNYIYSDLFTVLCITPNKLFFKFQIKIVFIFFKNLICEHSMFYLIYFSNCISLEQFSF